MAKDAQCIAWVTACRWRLSCCCARVVPGDSTLAYNISVAEEEAHFCWSKEWGSAMESMTTMTMDNVEALRLKGGETLTAGGAGVDVSAKLKAGFCQSSCCC